MSRTLLTGGLALSALLSVAAVVPAQAALTQAAPAGAGVVDIAHRGSSGSAPENTVAAIEYAVDQRASFVEVDVQRSADGELVLIHDTTLARTTNVEEVFPDRAPWNVGDFTLAELKQLDAGTWFSEDFAGEPVPTLREGIEALGSTGLLLEFKAPELYPGIEAEIHEEVSSIPGYLDRALRTGRYVAQSFNIESMRTYHEIAPEVPVGLLYGSRPSDEVLVEASEWADQINPSQTVTDQALVDRVHELGMTISVYTLNTGQLMRRFIDLGVDGIITDYPGVLHDILRNS
ncbi:glycerophosphodiester phosphodiesterase [Jiangella asiatica]|uniref:Glycerophosphodiester phosphodiesterase n=1 Tax=Jiangella asiatica TaxID=2530372 RepID=A0A4R5CT65_9ACTN|nr:glycerophosphodiester phosphodiesterase family protein [Jiangella asiatica]TDE02590.1 glycerophosphodiester phosphodiesterase [Jiangella asiatica]